MMNLSKVMRVAAREFASTALTKGFIVGALVLPAVMVVVISIVVVIASTQQPPADTGTVYLVDRSKEVSTVASDRLSPEQVEKRWTERAERVKEVASGFMGGLMGKKAEQAMDSTAQMIKFPEFKVVVTEPDADLDPLKAQLRDQVADDPSNDENLDTVIAIVEIDANATRKADGEEDFGVYQAFFRPKLNDETIGEIESSVRWSIRELRYQNAGIDRGTVSELDSVRARDSQEITEEGERKESSGLSNFMIPFASLMLLLMASMTGGQYLLTTTVEEKSNRVVEVLLSAVSPLELMTGKIVGQMGVGLSLLTIYNGVGIGALVFFNRGDLVSPITYLYIFVFFILAYFMFASLMAAIGSAVNDLREAQSLMTPVMMMMILPYIFFMPVIRSPNSMFSTITSFIPPISPFIMIMRVASNDPPPVWQVLMAIGLNAIAVVLFLWFAAKVFRVGLLMFGKPPNIRTLIKWVRMA